MKPITARYFAAVCVVLFFCLFAIAAQGELTVPLEGNQSMGSANSAKAKQAQAQQNAGQPGGTPAVYGGGNMPGKQGASGLVGSATAPSNLNFTSGNTVKGTIHAANDAKVNIGGLDLNRGKGNGPVAPVSNQPSGIVESSAFQAVYKDAQILSASSPLMSGNPSGVVKLSQVNTKIGELQKTMQDLEACQKRADTDLDRGSLQIQHDVINGVLGELESARQALKDGLVGLAPDMRTEGIKPIDTSKLGKEISRLQNANTELAKSKEQAATKAEQGKFQIQADLNQQKIDQYMAAQADLRSLSVGLNPYEKCGLQEQSAQNTKQEIKAEKTQQQIDDEWKNADKNNETVADINSSFYKENNPLYKIYQNGKPTGQCTWYAYGRFLEVNHIKLRTGNAGQWLDNNKKNDKVIVTECKPGNYEEQKNAIADNSIAVRKARGGNCGNGTTCGHVIFVEHVTYDSKGNPDKVYYTESNIDGNKYYDSGKDAVVSEKSFTDFIKEINGYITPKTPDKTP